MTWWAPAEAFSNLHYPNPTQVSGIFDSTSQAGLAFYSRRIAKGNYIGVTYDYQRLVAYPAVGVNGTQAHAALIFYTLSPKSSRFSVSFFGGPQRSDTVQTPSLPRRVDCQNYAHGRRPRRQSGMAEPTYELCPQLHAHDREWRRTGRRGKAGQRDGLGSAADYAHFKRISCRGVFPEQRDRQRSLLDARTFDSRNGVVRAATRPACSRATRVHATSPELHPRRSNLGDSEYQP